MVIRSFILCVNVAAGSKLICASVFSYICKDGVLKPDIDFHRCSLVSLLNRSLVVFICQEHVFFFFPSVLSTLILISSEASVFMRKPFLTSNTDHKSSDPKISKV